MDLCWIVHTCDGSGCREAKHVTFHSMTGFSTYEGQPPEQAEGIACSCTIANHHLRGYGTVRWEGAIHPALGAPCCAVVEDTEGKAASVDGRAYMAKAKKLSQQVRELERKLAEKRSGSSMSARGSASCAGDANDVSC